MEDLHIFYVESYFHLLLAESYIADEGIDASHVFFVTHRGVKLPPCYKERLLYDGTESQFKDRVKMYRKDRKRYQVLFRNKRVCSYSPFQFFFPRVRFFEEYNLIEEGFSAYFIPREISGKKALGYELFKALSISVLFPFASKNIKGFLMGISYSSPKASRPTKLLVSNGEAYGKYDFGKWVKKQIVPVTLLADRTTIRERTILVMDRLSKKGRPFDDSTYLSVLKGVLARLGLGHQNLLVKLHPADLSIEKEVKDRVYTILVEMGITPTFVEDNLEELALSDNSIIFIGTNSTSLFYAPIFGRTNRSISFARILAKADKQYAQFLENWGGTERFCEIFSRQVECL